ncbi:MAG: hypothetical protein ABIK56_02140 [candidate division WOR-3 bacterium]
MAVHKTNNSLVIIKNFLDEISGGKESAIKNKILKECQKILKESSVFTLDDFLNKVYPVLELALCWRAAKSKLKATIGYNEYFEQKKKRLIDKNYNNFIGAKFEILALGFLALNPKIEIFELESQRNTSGKIDFKGKINGNIVSVECKYVRENKLSEKKIEKLKKDVDKKFKNQNSKKILILGYEGFYVENPFEEFNRNLISLNEKANELILQYVRKVEEKINSNITIELQQMLSLFTRNISWIRTFATRLILDKNNFITNCFVRNFILPEPFLKMAGEEEKRCD